MSSLVRKANAGPLAEVPVNAAEPLVMVETRTPVSVLAAIGICIIFNYATVTTTTFGEVHG